MLDRPDFQQALRYVFEEKIPFCRALGLKLEVVRTARAGCHIAKQDFMLGNTKLKVLHGGVTAAVLDSIAGVAIMLRMAETDPKPDLETQLREFARLTHHRPARRLPGAGERGGVRGHRQRRPGSASASPTCRWRSPTTPAAASPPALPPSSLRAPRG